MAEYSLSILLICDESIAAASIIAKAVNTPTAKMIMIASIGKSVLILPANGGFYTQLCPAVYRQEVQRKRYLYKDKCGWQLNYGALLQKDRIGNVLQECVSLNALGLKI